MSASDDAKRAVLSDGNCRRRRDQIAASLTGTARSYSIPLAAPAGAACYFPDWLRNGRTWGIGCQLYSLRSDRNWGIGDFEDLARLAEIAAAAGADFVGVNPLHALFLADPERASPFFPSNRAFLNPLYIAVDKAPGFTGMEDALVAPEEIQASEFVEYGHVATLKKKALTILFRIFQVHADKRAAKDFERFVLERGEALYLHALFETLSEAMQLQGNGPAWHGWPEEFRHPRSDAVRAFAEEQRELVTFHTWLQWLADRHSEAQARALAAASDRPHLDLPSASPRWIGTWSDRDLIIPSARIGAAPD